MDSFLIYLLQVTAGFILLYICFLLFYRNDTFYQRNRVLLILIMILPALFPLLSLRTSDSDLTASPTIIIVGRIASAGQDFQSSVAGGIDRLNISTVIFVFWLTGLCLLVLRTLLSFVRTINIIVKGEKISCENLKIIVSDLPHPPFSIWPYAVIPRNIYNSAEKWDIIKHEEYHIRKLHTIDLILSELFIAFFWFNPAAWLIKRSIVLNHEYLADNKVIHETKSIKEYQYRLVNLATGMSPANLIHNFSNAIKNRIKMINKETSPRLAMLKNLLFVPLVLILFLSFSFKGNLLLQKEQGAEKIFSGESQNAITKIIYENIRYPDRAKANGDTGQIVFVLRALAGGTIEVVDSYTGSDKPSRKSKYNNIRLLNEIVVPGRSEANLAAVKAGRERLFFTGECLRVIPLISSLDLPEWNKTPFEFRLSFKFSLSVDGILSSQSDLDSAVIIVDGKEITRKGLEAIELNKMQSLVVLRNTSETALYGERGKKGLVVIATKK